MDDSREPPPPMSEPQENCEVTVTIRNRDGLHARPAMAFVDLANQFQSRVTVRKADQAVDGKSIMQMMMLAATCGSELNVKVTGPDAPELAEAIKDLVDRKFNEE